MEVRSDRRYVFDVGADELWAAIGEVDAFGRWWPWLRRFEAEALRTGDMWRCTVRPPLPYVVRFTIMLDDVVDGRSVAATVGGDLRGWALLDVEADGDQRCAVRLRSGLSPTNPALRAVAAAAAPVARYGHDWVLDTGARQFRDRALGGR